MPSLQELLHERDQLLAFWRQIDSVDLKRRAAIVVAQYRHRATYRDKSHHIRQFHNVLGYMAAGSLARGGLCAGCLYRTEAFIKLPQDLRTGSKRHPDHLTKVHVEHTIPVSVLAAEIAEFDERYLNEETLTKYLLHQSIVTAMLEGQGRIFHPSRNADGIVLPGFAMDNGAFRKDHPHSNRPFMRYTAQATLPRIFNVLTSEQISLESFTMQDFHHDLQVLLSEAGRKFNLQ